MEERPLVSVIIPVRNEESYIGPCLESILANDYPSNRFEVIVVDGRSSDRTREILSQYTGRFRMLRVIDNPKLIQAPALNLGIDAAQGEIIVRMDAHARYASDYLTNCVTLLQTRNAQNVGGPQRAEGFTPIQRAIAIALTSRFGVGNAQFRYTDREVWTDTVYLGAWRKETLVTLGGFNEDWAVNEDYELNYRLRLSGGRILVSPSLRCSYYVRNSLLRLFRQYLRYGFWRARTVLVHPGSLRARQLAPPLFICLLAASVALAVQGYAPALLFPLAYLGANSVVSALLGARSGPGTMLALPAAFFVMHLSWGIGFICGLALWTLRGWRRLNDHQATSGAMKGVQPRSTSSEVSSAAMNKQEPI